MPLQKERFTVSLLIVLLCGIPTSVQGRSVYAIPKHTGTTMNVYDIQEGAQEGQLEYRATYELNPNLDPTDVMIDTQSNMLFVTSEYSRVIQLINARTFLSEGDVTASGASDLAGLELDYVDPNTTLLYTVDRGTNKLFMYDWDAKEKNLTLLPYSPKQKWYTLLPQDPENDPCVFACGLALDEADGTLYVSQFKRKPSIAYSNIVYAYDPNVSAPDPNDRFRCTRKIDLGEYEGKDNYAVDIDVDSVNGWLYAGGYTRHQNLIRFDLDQDDPCAPDYDGHIQPICKGVIGLAVSQQSHNVYMTTYNHKLEAWDTNKWMQLDAEDIGAGAGVCLGEVGYVPPFAIVKVDDVNDCVSPRGQQIEYTISFDYQWNEAGDPDPNIFNSIKVVDYLPAEVNFISAQPDDGLYEYDDPNGARYTWTLADTSSFGDTHYFELVVQAQNERLTPGGVIENVVKLTATINEGVHIDRFTLETPVCDCTGHLKVIYVDETVPDPCDGSSWDKAFKKLQDALAVALPCDEIWVADGTYKPTDEPYDTDATFPMVNGVGIYGGFEGTEEERSDRNWADPCKETILSGDIAGDEDSFYVVSSDADVEVGCLDGFTIKRGSVAGIYCEEGSPIIQHNKIMASGAGIYCKDTEQPVIKNNWIYRNDYGMYFDNPTDTAMVRNNTVVYNDEVGIAFEPGTTTVNGCLTFETGTKPVITNCILWGNGDESVETQLSWEYMEGLFVQYSCIQNSNDVTPQPPYYTINTDPCFAEGTDNYLLKPISACIDAGDPNGDYTGERDIDKHFRLLDGNDDDEKRVDMGADEYCNQGSENDADFNKDGIVDTNDLRELATAWLIDANDPDWHDNYARYNLNADDDVIHYGDFAYFAQEWLWIACWKMADIGMMEPMMGAGGGMDGLAGAESQQSYREPTIEERMIAQLKEALNRIEEEGVKTQADEDVWLCLLTSLEKWLKELEQD